MIDPASGVNPASGPAAASGVSAPALKAGVGLLGVVMLGAGTAIGVSVFSVLGPSARVAGSGLLVAIVLAALPMLLFAIVYGFLSSVLPKSGASYEWPARFVHPLFGFLVAWLRILGSVSVIATLLAVLVNYLGMAVAIDPTWVKLAVLTALFGLNVTGVAVAARAQTVMMVVLLGVLGMFVVTGAPLIQAANLGHPTARGWGPIVAAVPLMITLFLGIETATEIGEEVRDARHTIPRGIALAIALTAVVYIAVAVVALGLVGPAQLAASKAPLLEAARRPLGPLALPVIVGAAVFAVLKTLNSSVMIFSRYLFAMGRAGVLPAALGRVHGRFGTPQAALLVAYVAALVGLLLPSGLVFLLLAVNIPTMLKYLGSCLSAVRLVRHHPQLHAQAALPLRRGTVTVVGWAGVVAAIAVIVAGLGADWRPYLLVAGWGAIGLAYWYVRRGRRRR